MIYPNFFEKTAKKSKEERLKWQNKMFLDADMINRNVTDLRKNFCFLVVNMFIISHLMLFLLIRAEGTSVHFE